VKITPTRDGVLLSVYVQPRASRSEIVGEHGEALKIRLAAPPVDGAANDELIHFISKLLGISASKVSVRSGQSSRTKVIEISGISLQEVSDTLAKASQA
jgi:uncharacterized protein (TIGR00251 family)